MARTILRDEARLHALYLELERLTDAIDNTANVPQRFDSTALGIAAELDSERIRAAASSVHRLRLWAKHPTASPERYTRHELDAPKPEPFTPEPAA